MLLFQTWQLLLVEKMAGVKFKGKLVSPSDLLRPSITKTSATVSSGSTANAVSNKRVSDHPHYIEHHGKRPSWLADHPGLTDDENVNKKKKRWCQQEKVHDTKFRIEQVMQSLPLWVIIVAKFAFVWEFVLYALTMLTFALVTFVAFFAFYEQGVAQAVYVLDLLYALDILMRLVVEVWRCRNQTRAVIFMIPYHFLHYLLDLLSILPLYQLYFTTVGTSSLYRLNYVDYWRFNSFLRLYRSHVFFSLLQHQRWANEKLLFLFRFLNTYIACIHLVSCFLMYLVGVEPLDFLLHRRRELLDQSWMRIVNKEKSGFPTENPHQIYVLATSLATATVTTVGYGDLAATNEVEMFWCVIFMVTGAILLTGYFLSQLTNLELDMDGAMFELFHRVREILNYLKDVSVPPLLIAKVEEYYKHLWSYCGGVYYAKFMEKLPPAFQQDLLYDICQEMFDKSTLFNGLDEAFLRAIAKAVKVALFNPHMNVCRKGDYANKLCYILQGECAVMSKYSSSKVAAILRTGSIIGEMNLLFSYPYTTTVQTTTCCQFILLEKEDLIMAIQDFQDQLQILRTRCQMKIKNLYAGYTVLGIPPVCWVAAKTDLENPDEPKPSRIGKTMRWGTGFNKAVIMDVVNDAKEIVIFETPCENQEVMKDHLIPYKTATVPEIMDSPYPWMKYWNMTIMIITLIHAFIGSYCISFGENSTFEHRMCYLLNIMDVFLSLFYATDAFIEVIAAVPVHGLRYKIVDGWKVKRGEFTFYLDILAAVPLGFFSIGNGQDLANILDVTFKCLKLWKVIRYLKFLDNRHSRYIFWFRLLQALFVVVYGSHFVACILFILACRTDPATNGQVCANISWMKSYELQYDGSEGPNPPRWMLMEIMRDRYPYLYSISFASGTITSAGFGDFSPQTFSEMYWCISFQLMGFFIIGYYTATLTSALACIVRPELVFQQRLVSIMQFLVDHHLPEGLRDRIIEYYKLQSQLRGGVHLDRGVCYMMYDSPDFLRNDILYLEVMELLEGIPIFTKADPDVIITMAKHMKRFLIPANTTFLHRGEIRRVMYVIKHGSIGFFPDQSGEEKPLNILEASGHFGIRDLLFGEPCHFTIRSLSQVCMYSIKLHQLEDAMAEDNEFWEFVDHERVRMRDHLEELATIYSKLVKISQKSSQIVKPIPNWIEVLPENPDAVKMKDKPMTKKEKAVNDQLRREYEGPFLLLNHCKMGKILKRFLMPRTINPVGGNVAQFSLGWGCFTSFISFFVLSFMVVETFMSYRPPYFRFLQWILDVILMLDIYVNMHWSYYLGKRNFQVLVTHPLKTFLNYVIHGPFIIDVLACIPVEMLVVILGWTNMWGYGEGAMWYTKLRWIRILHARRLSVLFHVVHSIVENRSIYLLILYAGTSLMVCTLLGSVCIYFACPWGASVWNPGDEHRMPVCLERMPHEDTPQFWATKKYGDDAELLSDPFDRFILSVYYVSQVVLVIGFGDLITLRFADVVILCFMQIFGFILMRCVIADMTAAEVDSDEIRYNFYQKLKRMKLVMLRQNVVKSLMKTVKEHLVYQWKCSKGLQPRDLFADLHPALESDLFRELVGKDLADVALFRGLTGNILRTVSGYMRKVYYVRGERMMRCGNLENELRIITKGKVFICDKNYNYLCTLQKGDCFGESDMLNMSRARYNAIAMTKVECFYLTYSTYELLMERYPTFQAHLAERLQRGFGGRDYFEIGLEQKMDDAMSGKLPLAETKRLIYSFQVRREMIMAAVSLREDMKIHGFLPTPWYHWSKWVAFGNRNEGLPFIYLAKPNKQDSGTLLSNGIMIHPLCGFVRLYTHLIFLLCFLTPALAAYQVCFIGTNPKLKRDLPSMRDPASNGVQQASLIFEIFIFFHMLFQFITPFEEEISGVFCKTYKCIITRYLTMPAGFLLDAFACIPFLVDIFYGNRLVESQCQFLYLFKIVRLVKFYNYLLSQKDNVNISTLRYKITISISSFLLVAHMIACAFYKLSACQPLEDLTNLCPKRGQDTWTSKFASENKFTDDPADFLDWKWYIRSVYWVVTTVSTTGYGDIVPYTVSEMGLSIICIFCGAFILSLVLGDFTAGMASVTKSYRAFVYQVQLLVRHLRNVGLSGTRQNQVAMQFLTLWERSRGSSYNEAVTGLHVCLHIDVCNALFGECLRKVPYFRGHDEQDLTRQLAARVVHSVYIPGICIVKEGDHGSSLFVVLKGIVAGSRIVVEDDEEMAPKDEDVNILLPKAKPPFHQKKHTMDKSMKLVTVYGEGDVFGHFPGLFRDETYKKSYRAETRVEAIEIHQDVLHLLARKFPYLRRNLEYLISSRYDPEGLGENILSNIEVAKHKH